MVKKQQKRETNNWCFWGRGWSVREASMILLSFWLCAVKHITLYFLCIFNLLWFICSHWSCCQAFLWPTDFSKVALPRKVLSLIWGKIENPSYLQLFFQFTLALLCTSKTFSFSPFSPFKTKSLVNQRQPICTSVVKLLANIDAKVTLKMYLCNQCILD